MLHNRLNGRPAGAGRYSGKSAWRLALLACLAIALLAGGGSNPFKADASAPVNVPPAAQAQPQSTPLTPALVMRAYFRNNLERDSLANEFDALEVATTGGYITILGDSGTYNELLRRGLRVEVDEAATKQVNAPIQWNKGTTFYNGYHTVEEVYAYLDQMVATYPTLAEKVNIGPSWCLSHPGQCTAPNTWGGYDLYVLHITNQAIAGPKPVFWYENDIHAREIATPELAMRYISMLLDGYASNPDSHWLVDWHDIWVMPFVNPDGHHMVEAGGNNPYLQRKNANRTQCTTWPPPGIGIDNNRNFPFQWGCCGGSSGTPCSEVYRGPSAGSEPETQAVMAQVSALIPVQRGQGLNDPAPITTTGIFQDLHTSGEMNLYPWGFTGSLAPNGTDLGNVARHGAATNASPPGNGYLACQPPNCLYAVDGDTTDWTYGHLGISSVSTELSGNGFLPSYSCIDNPGCGSTLGIWPENRGMLTYMAKVARTPYLTTRGPDTVNIVTSPMTVTQGMPSELSGTINYAWTGNSYTQNVAAAEYYIDTPPWAGGTPFAMAGVYNSPTVPVYAVIDTTPLSVGRHVIFVRGRGVNDYSGFQSWGVVSAAWLDILPPVGTPTPTFTGTPPTNTPTRTPTYTPTQIGDPTITPQITATFTPTPTHTPTIIPSITASSTFTRVPTITTTPCAITFTDVQPTDYFYTAVTYLWCHGVISGYADNTFRPYNNTTRGQSAKIVVLAEGWPVICPPTPTFTDVPPSDPFYCYIETINARHVVSGYEDGTFHPYANVTRGQLSKIIVNAEGWTLLNPPNPTFTDVLPGSPFYQQIETAYSHGIISGYSDGTFRPGNDATRGQVSKIVYDAITAP